MRDALPTGFIAMPGTGHGARAVLLGLSGGLDSSALLHQLASQPGIREAGLRAIHVHHGLHPAADDWAVHCRAACDALDIPLAIIRVEVPRNTGSGLEAAARKARRDAFMAALHDDEVLALAHHRDDQAETFLLRALRASGPDGLAAMRQWQRFGSGWLWRPLLGVPRATLRAYAQARGLGWIDDPGNGDTAHDRNFLRHRVLPLLRERWPAADASLARSAALAAEAGELLAGEDAGALDAARTPDRHTLSVTGLAALPPGRRARVLRRWIADLGLPPLPAQGVAHIEDDLLPAAADADAMFEWQGCTVRRWRGLLHGGRRVDPLPPAWRVAWDGRLPLALPDGGELRLEGAGGFETPLLAHARQGGERIRLPGRAHSHALKHVLQDLGIPPWRRQRLPLLSGSDGQVQAAGDLVTSAPFDAWLRARGAHLAWHDPAVGVVPRA